MVEIDLYQNMIYKPTDIYTYMIDISIQKNEIDLYFSMVYKPTYNWGGTTLQDKGENVDLPNIRGNSA